MRHLQIRSYIILVLIKSENETRINQQQYKNYAYGDLWKIYWKLTGNNEKQALTMNGTINYENKEENKLKELDFIKKGLFLIHAVLGKVGVRWR